MATETMAVSGVSRKEWGLQKNTDKSQFLNHDERIKSSKIKQRRQV